VRIKWARTGLMILDLIALLIIITWTCCDIKADMAGKEVRDVSLEIKPDYQITSGKKLSIWPAETVFEQGMAAYFYASKPTICVAPSIEVPGLEQGDLHTTMHSEIVLQAIDDKSQIYWSYSLEKLPIQSFTLSKDTDKKADQLVYHPEKILLDAPAAYQRAAKFSKELKFEAGIFQLVLSLKIRVIGTVNGMDVNKTVVQILPVHLNQVYFTIPKTQDVCTTLPLVTNDGNLGRKTSEEALEGRLVQVVLILIFGVLLYILLVKKKMEKPKVSLENRRFREWITEGSVDIQDRFRIHILNLEGLVDLAIDLDSRVIHDSKIDQYYVFAEDMVYCYDPGKADIILVEP
jgi:hypothetical protein